MDDIVYIVGAAGGTTESSGGSSVSINADYKNPGDFTVTYSNSTTLALSLMSDFVQDTTSIDFVYLKILRASTGLIELIINGVDDTFTYTPGNPKTSGTLVFTSTILGEHDSFEVGINGDVSSVEGLRAIETELRDVHISTGNIETALGTGGTLHSDIINLNSTMATAPITLQGEYASPMDFAVTLYSATAQSTSATLTVSGAPFTVDDTNCTVISIMKLASGTWTKYTNGQNGVSITCASNVITIAGAGTPFANTDIAYRVVVSGQRKGYDPSTNTLMVTEQAPNRAAYVQDSIWDGAWATDVSTTFNLSMDGYKDFSLTGLVVQNTSNIDTIYIDGTNDEDPGTYDWVQLYFYDLKSNAMVNSIAFTSTGANGTSFAISIDDCNFSTLRVRYYANNATPHNVYLKARRKA